jgi:hypothetical protein
MAVLSIPPRLREEAFCCCFDGVELDDHHLNDGEHRQDDEVHCSASKNVVQVRTVSLALSSSIEAKYLPVIRRSTFYTC